MIAALCLALLAAPDAHAASDGARTGNQLSKRTQLRYQDVLTTRSGSKWRGKLIERGEVFRIRLDDNSEVAVPKEEVASITREPHPGYPHTGQWETRAAAGAEVAFVTATTNAGLQVGPYVEVGLGRNFGGGFEPELVVILTPIGPEDGRFVAEIGVAARYYLQPFKRVKPYTNTQIVLYGTEGDLGLRTGPGFLIDVSPNFGIGMNQGVTLISQEGSDGELAAGIGYHFTFQAQGRF
jgi:hypothetical protein